MVWNFELLVPEMANYDTHEMPLTDVVFKRETLYKNYKTLLKLGENFDLHNIVNNYKI